MHLFGHPVPQRWLDVFYTIQRRIPEAVLAGGCLRDLALGGEVKDLDVFIPYEPEISQGIVNLMARGEGWVPGQVIAIGDYVAGFGTEVPLVQEFRVHGLDQPVQIIHLANGPTGEHFNSSYVISRVDFGACMVAIDHRGLNYNGHFLRDIRQHQFTLLRAESEEQVVRSYRRAQRLLKKYPTASMDMSKGERLLGHTLRMDQSLMEAAGLA